MKGKQYFDKVAPLWDKLREGFFSERVREKAILLANVQPGKIAVDIGAGTGFITEELLKKGLKVIAIDQSEAMIREMKKRFKDESAVDYRIGVAKKLPVKDGYVDYAFANMFLHHIDNPLAAIKEMSRILKPSGALVITDLDKHNFKFLKIEQHDRWLGFKREDVKRWLVEAGLKEVKIDCAGENCFAQSDRKKEYASISIFVATGKK
jgi:ubiquinone/menaquinone biosynthesis C-methylase UbiE